MKMMLWAGVLALMLAVANRATAQVNQPPFFIGGAGAFAPQVSVVNSGAVLDAQAVVSADRKYVTLNMRPTNSALLALQTYSINSGAINLPQQGFAGGANLGGGASPARRGTNSAARAIPTVPSILDRRGMTRLD